MGSFSASVMCPVFIGRVPERVAFSRLLEQTRSGQGVVALVSGEAGVGKSRLVTEVKTSAEREGFLLLQGNCFQTDRSFPYAPLLDLFRAYFMKSMPISAADNVRLLLVELSRLLPDLVLLFPDLASQPTSLTADPEQEKRRLFAVMTHFFIEMAAQYPVLFMIEDVHWCDDLSLEFLLHLARRSSQVPLLLLMTYRNDEQHPQLRQWLSQLDRERLMREFSLTRLSRADVAAMLQSILALSQEVDADLLDILYTLSEGNPFFVEELLKSLITTGELVSVDKDWKFAIRRTSVPRSIQEAVQQRMVYLSVDAKKLLTLAAIAGRRFDITLLQKVMHCDEAHLLTLLKEVMAAQLVIEETTDQFAFRHALTQQAIVAELLLRERQALHRMLAESLEQLSTSPSLRERLLGELAMHCYEGGMWERAMLYEQQMGERSLILYAPHAAIEHLTRAVDAAHHVSLMPSSQVYRERGRAYETLGEFDRARGDYERALDAARNAHDASQEWQSGIALGSLWAGRDYTRAGFWFHQTLDLAEKLADPLLHAHSLNRLGNWLVNTGKIEEGLQAHQRAFRIFEKQSDTQGMAETLDLLGTTYGLFGDKVNAVQHLGEAIVLLRTLGDHQSLASSLAMRAIQSGSQDSETTFHALRTRKECMQDAEEALHLARQSESLSGQAFAEIALNDILSTFGELGQALAHGQEAMRIATAIQHQQWMAVAAYGLGDTYLLLLQPALTREVLESGVEIARSLGSAFLLGILTALQGLAYLTEHNLPQAQATLASIMPPEQIPYTLAERQVAWVWGELALAQGEPKLALQRAEQLLASAPGEPRTQPIPHLLKLKGESLMALSRFEEAVQAFDEAKRGASMRNDKPILWRIHRSFGHLYRRLKREEDAQQHYSDARQIVEALASSINEAPLREHFLDTALSSFPRGNSRVSRRAAKQVFDGLTTREREVAVLVAQGWTNGEIATHLVVSERTADSHVSNILGKLGFTSRAQIAAWAVKKGLSAF